MKKKSVFLLVLFLMLSLSIPGYAKKRKPPKPKHPPKVEKRVEKIKEKVVIKELVDANFAISYDIFTRSFRSFTLDLPEYEAHYFMPHPVGIQMRLSHDDIFMRLGVSLPVGISYDTRGKSVPYGIYQNKTSYEYFSAGLFYQGDDSFYAGFEFNKGKFKQELTFSQFLYYQDPNIYGPGKIDLETELDRWYFVIGWAAKPTNIGLEFGINLRTEKSPVKQFGLGFPKEVYDIDIPVSYLRINLWL